MNKFYKAFILFLILTHGSYPQSQFIKFDHITVKDGISHADIQDITQDHQGFMWFATVDGLNKYDGYKITTYRHDPADSTSLGNNNIRSVYEDPSGNLWISILGGGLNKYDRENDNFIRYTPASGRSDTIYSHSIEVTTGSRENGSDILWIGSENGLYKMDIAKETFRYYAHTDQGPPYTSIETLLIDSEGNIWIGCDQGGIYKFDPHRELFTQYQHDPNNPNSLSDNTILRILEDKSGIFWIATAFGGLNRFDPDKEEFINYQHDPDDPLSLRGNYLLSLFEDRAGNLWIATAEGGLNLFDRETGKFVSYQHDPNYLNSLSDNTVKCIYEDKSGVLWMGTWVGINKFDPRKIQFADYIQKPLPQRNLTNSFITAICESNHRGEYILWVAPKTGGIYRLNRKNGRFRHYPYEPGKLNSFPSNRVQALLEDRDGSLWIGTWGNGLIKYDPNSEKFTRFMIYPTESNRSSLNIIRSIFQDSESILWVGTHNGLFRFNPEFGQFTRMGSATRTMSIYEDEYNDLWIATFSGLKRFDRDSEKFTTYRHNPEDPNSISHDQILSIYKSARQNDDILWIGTDGGGLNKFHRKLGQFTNYTVKAGLPNNAVNGILEDDNGNLWLSTNNGLSKFDPKKETFRNYDINDGLFSNQFYPGACYKSTDGEMFFGSSEGLCAFYPANLTDNPNIPEVVLTDFQIFNASVSIRKAGDAEKKDVYTLPRPITLLDEVKLSYRQNVFSFEFAALDYWSPEKNLYKYKLEGFDKDWNFTGADRRFAAYTNLDPGEYIFRVKGSNNDGIWNEEGTSIKVIITPPWWKTSLAYIFYIVGIIALTISAWRFQIHRLKIRHRMEMNQLRADKLEEVDRMKSRFFANISHEFRMPLTLILGPVRQMLSGEFSGNFKEQYKMIIRSGERLLNLINQLLDLSKLESGKMKLQANGVEIVRFTNSLCQVFESLAAGRHIHLKFSAEPEMQEVYIDPEKYETVINNLLSNAIKATLEGEMIEVNLTLLPLASPLMHKGGIKGGSEGYIKISISNTGPGIPSGQLDHIFDRFYQTDNSYKKDEEGSGIGLALTRELVELHHGKILVESIPDAATTFSVLLPLGKVHLEQNELSDTGQSGGLYHVPEPAVIPDKVGESDKTEIIDNYPKTCILIVEDNADLRQHICINLSHTHAVIDAENGEEGFNLAAERLPDLIISDVMMPVMDGFEFCEKIKTDERTSHIPVILLTARAGQEDRIEGLETGADDYVIKPFDINELKIRAKNLIDQRRKLREKFVKDSGFGFRDIAITSADEKFIKRIMDLIFQNLSDAGFHIEGLAEEIGMSRSHLYRKILALSGQSPSEFLRTIRLKRGAELLREKTGNISEIAYQVGFNNPASFATSFRKQFGITPSEYAQSPSDV